MKYINRIANIFSWAIKQEKKVLGRWTIESCDKKMNNKIDLSNEDHCGPCGQYILKQTLKYSGERSSKEYKETPEAKPSEFTIEPVSLPKMS